MFKNLKKIIIILLFFLFSTPCLADGGMIPYHYPNYKDIYEPSQTSLIVYGDNNEDLYIKANYEGETNKFVWVVPTPSYPKVELSPRDIFDELSIYTTDQTFSNIEDQKQSSLDNFSGDANVIVHEQKQVGIYKVTVLSATGVDGLYAWLEENNYPVKEDIKNVLDWYIDKEWYFTVMKIDPSAILDQIINDFDKKVDVKITKDNLAEEISKYYINAVFVEKDFDKFKEAIDYLLKLAPNDHKAYDDLNDIKNWSEEKFQEKVGSKNFSEEELSNGIEKVKSEMDSLINDISPENIDKYSDYIEPIKISFSSNSIVYPLKISQISTSVPDSEDISPKTNEVLLYVLAHDQVVAPGFSLEYGEKINKNNLETFEQDLYSSDLENLKNIIGDNNYFLTKMRRDFSKEEMDDDLYFISSNIYKAINENEIIPLSQAYSDSQTYQDVKNKIKGSALSDRLKGKIIIKVEDAGKAYYINPTTKYSHYLGRPADAFSVMREQGVGITNSDLNKIPMGLSSLSGQDSDNDGLPDKFEDAIGTNMNNQDTDGDGYSDKQELESNYNPRKGGGAKLNINNDFAEKQKGKILLQVEQNGEAWYVNPEDGKRYFLGRPNDAFQVMHNLGLGISNEDFDKL